MRIGTGDLIQSTLESWESNDWCGAGSGEWCVRASVFGWFGQLDGDAGVVKADDQVRIEYTLQDDQDTWVQYVLFFSSWNEMKADKLCHLQDRHECGNRRGALDLFVSVRALYDRVSWSHLSDPKL
jgi:hypothetical protein